MPSSAHAFNSSERDVTRPSPTPHAGYLTPPYGEAPHQGMCGSPLVTARSCVYIHELIMIKLAASPPPCNSPLPFPGYNVTVSSSRLCRPCLRPCVCGPRAWGWSGSFARCVERDVDIAFITTRARSSQRARAVRDVDFVKIASSRRRLAAGFECHFVRERARGRPLCSKQWARRASTR